MKPPSLPASVQHYFHCGMHLNIHWKDWCWSWSSNTLPTWCEELTHLKRPWCWERLKAGGEGDERGWDGWMASPMWWTWVWVSSGSWWWTGKPGVLQSMGSQRLRIEWLNWTDTIAISLVATWCRCWDWILHSLGLLVYPALEMVSKAMSHFCV